MLMEKDRKRLRYRRFISKIRAEMRSLMDRNILAEIKALVKILRPFLLVDILHLK